MQLVRSRPRFPAARPLTGLLIEASRQRGGSGGGRSWCLLPADAQQMGRPRRATWHPVHSAHAAGVHTVMSRGCRAVQEHKGRGQHMHCISTSSRACSAACLAGCRSSCPRPASGTASSSPPKMCWIGSVRVLGQQVARDAAWARAPTAGGDGSGGGSQNLGHLATDTSAFPPPPHPYRTRACKMRSLPSTRSESSL